MLTIVQVETLRAEFLARLTLPAPKTASCRIKISDTMRTTGGRAHYRENMIELNARLLNANPTDVYQTVGHELAHLVSVEINGLKLGRGHGPNWLLIMRQFGLEPKRCHAMNTTGLRRRHATHSAWCNCMEHKLKTGRYNRMRRGARFVCQRCFSVLRFNQLREEIKHG